METIEEQQSQSKCGELTISALPTRICLVGGACQDTLTLAAAQSFDMPVVFSETGLDMINDSDWRTYYVLQDFEGPIYESIHKAKQCIIGPPALKYAAEMKYALGQNTRPIYNYSMRGVVTCFTGIRKKDELTKLVNLIHSMGGCIKKDLNTKTTHLICNHSGGEKYQYAKTFRLTVVRPAWVYAAWTQRNLADFQATTECFSKDHKLKAFEGQKICFFGFPSEEQQHMVDVLLENGGVPAELDDPECSHVVMPNAGAVFQRTDSTAASTNSHATNQTNNQIQKPNSTNPNHSAVAQAMDVDCEVEGNDNDHAEAAVALENVLKEKDNDEEDNEDDEDDDDDSYGLHFDPRLFVDYADISQQELDLKADRSHNADEELPDSDEDIKLQPNYAQLTKHTQNSNASTPKTNKQQIKFSAPKPAPILSPSPSPPMCTPLEHFDGVVLTKQTECDFNAESNNGNLSPILKEHDAQAAIAPMGTIAEGAIEDIDELAAANDLKRKRDSFDSISLVSIESFAQPTSTKKPKLIRTGSLKRTIKRSMSFVAERTPIFKTLRTRRSSIAAADASTYLANETTTADDSICSFASINTTLNESIRKPVKEKFRSICARVTRSASKKDKIFMMAEEGLESLNKSPESTIDFKTPKAPINKYNTMATATAGNGKTPKSSKRLFGNASNSISNAFTPIKDTFFPNTITHNTNQENTECLTMLSTATTTSSSTSCVNSAMHVIQIQQHNGTGVSGGGMECSSAATATAAVQCQTSKTHEANHMEHAPTMQPVVDEHMTLAKPETRNHHTHILKSDWFWYTIQNGFANEMDYLFGDYLDSIANTPNTDRRDSLPISFNKRKRKRLSQRLQFEGTPLGSGKRRSSVSDAGLLSSVSNSFFDCTTSPEKLECLEKLHAEPEICETTPTTAKKSMRFNHFMDFYTTESNYVGILDTILNLFKNKLEELAETNDSLLNKSEIKSIFGNFLPIHEVHQSMLEHLRGLHSNWREDCLIGDIIIQHRDELIKAYPPYVNFYEQMKEQLQECDRENPRFHAFLKINQTKPECGRQSLQDLMIRPVQRLPSISLLLNDILKHTHTANPDHTRLEEALKAIKEVTLHINEDKRRTESRMAIFDIFNDIEGCPAHLVSSNRSFISKCEVNELSDCLSGRGDSLMLYLFSDSIEVCKKRSRGFNAAKSPSTTKTHKHIKLISLNTIRIVIDIADSPRAFALLQRGEKEKLYTFSITDEETDKVVYLKKLCMQMAEHACRTDADKMLVSRTSQELDVDISDVNLSTLSKAFKLAAKTRLKVGRAFSFNKTPNKLKRAVSTMMTSPFGSTNSLTPATQLAQMRLASCTNIHEVADEDGVSMRSNSPSAQSEVLLVPPMSVQPTRKNKAVVGRI